MTIQTYHRATTTQHQQAAMTATQTIRATRATVESIVPPKSQPWPSASFQIPGTITNPHALNSPLMKTQLLGQSQPTWPLPWPRHPLKRDISLRRQCLLQKHHRARPTSSPPGPRGPHSPEPEVKEQTDTNTELSCRNLF